MGEIRLNTSYLQSHRGIIKILQIVLGFVIAGLLCGGGFGSACFGSSGQVGFCTTINFVCLIINIVFFVLNLINLNAFKLEKFYAIAGTILFVVGACLMIWFIVTHSNHTTYIIATVLVAVIAALFAWDMKILNGEASN